MCSKNVHTQLLNHNENRVHYLETCCMISQEKPLVCHTRSRELNEKSIAKEREEKKRDESGTKKFKGK